MGFLLLKTIVSDIVIALISTIARHNPAVGSLVASLPTFLVIPAMIRAGIPLYLSLAPGTC